MLATMGAALALEVVEQLSQGPVHEEPQPDAGVTYAERLTKDDSPIFWWRSAHELHNQVRGLHPWPLAVHDHRRPPPAPGENARSPTAPRPRPRYPGRVLEASGDRFVVAAGPRGAFASSNSGRRAGGR